LYPASQIFVAFIMTYIRVYVNAHQCPQCIELGVR